MQAKDFLISAAGAAGLATISVAFVFLFGMPRPDDLASTDHREPAPSPIPEETIEEPAHAATLYFVGDIMLARGVELTMATEGINAPFSELGNPFLDADAVIGNFEGTIRDQIFQEITHMTFDTPPSNAAMLKEHGFTHLSLSNNHGDDYGPAVTEYTRETISALGMTPFGDPYNSTPHIVRETWNGQNVSLIGWHAFNEELEPILAAIATEHATGQFVIVYPHWGPEYITTPHPEAQVYPGRAFVDAGADLVIGAHPHVIQEIETYNGVPIIYSLGNFLFDQDWSKPTQQGLMLKVTLTQDDITIAFMPVNVIKRHTTMMTQEEADAVLAPLNIPATLTVPRLQEDQMSATQP